MSSERCAAAPERADYAPTHEPGRGAWVASVEPSSPADDAGIVAGMRIDEVNGQALSDIITWRWEADGDSCELVVFDPTDEGLYACELSRDQGQDWGITFTDVLFDGIRTCRNACVFCFMSMLPPEARATLHLRDDDYRLSFLQGNFVTLTNLSDADVDRIVTCDLEPMNVSLHAVSPDVRRALMGANAARGLEVLEELLRRGIEVHAQVVVCPGINDGPELARTLDWVEARPLITSTALVPLGYTRYNTTFSSSFSDDAEASRRVVELVRPYQERSRERFGTTRFQLSDEFYLDAGMEVPPAWTYDGYPQFYDGIGMLRSFLDETDQLAADAHDRLGAVVPPLEGRWGRSLLVCGPAARDVYAHLVHTFGLEPWMGVLAVRNDYFGGDVNVTGLTTASDLLAQLPARLDGTLVVAPSLMLNFDGVTLDGMSVDDLRRAVSSRGGELAVCDTTPSGLLRDLGELAGLG